MANKLKLPPLGNDTKILSFDLETNGLHGQAFAVGAVVVDAKGQVLDKFIGRTEISGRVDDWVKENVLPVIEDMPVNYKSYDELKETFWQWYLNTMDESDYILVNNGYPVEYRFLLDCQEVDIDERYWQHPFPILDLTSLLVAMGEKPNDFAEEFLHKRKAHNPLDDATIAALSAFKAFRKSGQIS